MDTRVWIVMDTMRASYVNSDRHDVLVMSSWIDMDMMFSSWVRDSHGHDARVIRLKIVVDMFLSSVPSSAKEENMFSMHSRTCFFCRIHIYVDRTWEHLDSRQHMSLLQNIVSFIGLFCKRDMFSIHLRTSLFCRIHIYADRTWEHAWDRTWEHLDSREHMSLLQNIVSFIGLFCNQEGCWIPQIALLADCTIKCKTSRLHNHYNKIHKNKRDIGLVWTLWGQQRF